MDTTGPRVCSLSPLPDSVRQACSVFEFLSFSSSQPPCSPASGASPSSSTLPRLIVPRTANPVHSLLPPNYHTVQDMAVDILQETPQASHHKKPSVHPESSPPSPMGISQNSSSESSRDSPSNKDKKVGVVKAVRMKKSRDCRNTTTSGALLSPHSNKSPSDPRGTARISVSRTERETIVHTDSLNFREVVRQLTGASSDDKELLPVTLPTRHVNRADFIGKQENVLKVESVGTRTIRDSGYHHSESIKLHERRKAMKKLDKLTTIYKELPPLIPSPVTPLASDFEKFCLSATHTASQDSISVSPSDASKIVEEDGMMVDEQLVAEELAIAEKGFYLHSKRPRKSELTLLNLFPESPVCSPPGI